MLGNGEDVLVAATAHVHDREIAARQRRRQLLDEGQRVRRLQRRDDAFEPGAQLESGERLLVGDGDVFHAARLLEPGMLGSDARIVQARRDRMAFEDLSVRILQQIGAVAVQHAWLAAGERGAMPVRYVEAVPTRLHAVDRYALVIEEGMKEAD